MNLSELLAAIGPAQVKGSLDMSLTSLAYDSRKVRPGGAFFALPGSKADGHRFIQQALAAGATVVVGQADICLDDATYVRVYDSREALGLAAHAFFGDPSAKITLIGLTGTNGKTTTTYLLESILQAAGRLVGVIGTVDYRHPGGSRPANVTTPQSYDLAEIMADMVRAGVDAAVMEVSSHALDQNRTSGCRFDAVGFTNLSRDHLDYHVDMDDYFRAKSKLFIHNDAAPAAVNADDPYGARLIDLLGDRAIGFGLKGSPPVRPEEYDLTGRGVRATIITPAGKVRIGNGLLGRPNLMNLLMSVALAHALKVDPEAIEAGLNRMDRIPGRMENVGAEFGRRVLVDYSHTPDSLIKALETAAQFTTGRIITVFGCGGDRDRGKRPIMARAAAKGSQLVIATSDNPRTEDPEAILDEVIPGLDQVGFTPVEPGGSGRTPAIGSYVRLADRREAIRLAVSWAGPEDTVMICGKGHEDYQIIGTTKHHLDDREEALAALADKEDVSG